MGRTLTFWGMWIFFMILAVTPNFVAFVFIGLVSVVALYEYYCFQGSLFSEASLVSKIIVTKPAHVNSTAVCLSLAVIPINLFIQYLKWDQTALGLVPLVVILFLPSLLVISNETTRALANFGFMATGLLFFVYALSYAAALTRFGMMPLLLCVVFTELRDLVSYWAGKFFSKAEIKNSRWPILRVINHKIAPKVSPHKSWGVGLISILFIIVVGLLSRPLLPPELQAQATPALIALWTACLGFFGLMGDLVFSLFKREFGLKDSGSLLPGNTGMIDRIDGLVFTIPVTYFFFRWISF